LFDGRVEGVHVHMQDPSDHFDFYLET
jgi:hypothetical protein